MKLVFRVSRFGTKFIGGGEGRSVGGRLYLGTRSDDDDDDVVDGGIVPGVRRGLLIDFLLFILFFLYLSKELNVSSIGISLLYSPAPLFRSSSTPSLSLSRDIYI